MVTHTEARTFEIAKFKNVLENPETLLRSLEFVKIIKRDAIADSNLVLNWSISNRVLQICSNECRIRARWITDKNDDVYKSNLKETIHEILKAQKSLNHN